MLNQNIKNLNFQIIFITLILIAVGMMNLYSATSDGGQNLTYWKAHLSRFFVGLVFVVFLLFIHYRILERFAYLAYALNILALVAVLVLGESVLGSTRWIFLGPLTIQPSEFMKITMVWTLAKYFHNDRRRDSYGITSLWIPALLVGLPTGLIMVQPDLGTALILLVTSACMFIFIKINSRLLITISLAIIVFLPVAYKFILKDYQRQRIISFINPQADPLGAGYNSIQSMIAIGSGKFLGKGFNQGTQSQLKFLPEQHTDFIFSVFAEEHGFLWSILLIILFFLFLFQGLRISSGSNDKFAMLFSLGLVIVFFSHIVINIGMSMGIMPVVGVPLPFMSFGGSYLVSCMIAVGVLANISNKKSMF